MAWRSSSRPRTSQGYRNLITVESIADVVVLVTQSGLKDVNKLLKLDPSNTELVVQKQKMLKDAIQATFHTIDGIDHLPVLLTDTESADCTF